MTKYQQLIEKANNMNLLDSYSFREEMRDLLVEVIGCIEESDRRISRDIHRMKYTDCE